MEENLVKCLKAFATAIVYGYRHAEDEEDIVNGFLEKSELVLSPHAKNELINHLYRILKK